jgi:hypothetical protein
LTDDELLDALVRSAEAAILNERQGLSYDRARLKGITVELMVANSGGSVTGQCYIQRSVNLRKLLEQGPAVPKEMSL